MLNQKGLVSLYHECFAAPPYSELFADGEIEDIFLGYIEKGVVVIGADTSTSMIVAFAAAIPLKEDEDVWKIMQPLGYHGDKDWYYADLGTASNVRRQGLGVQIVTELIKHTPAKKLIMRTSEFNIASQRCNQKVGFQIIPDVCQTVSQKRQDGSIQDDRRIFLDITLNPE